MKNLLIISILLLLGCSNESKDIFETFSDGSPKAVRIYKEAEDSSNYQLIRYFQSGQVKFEGTVRENKFVGKKINYYKNGKIEQIDSLIRSCDLDYCCCDGKVIRYDNAGRKKEEFINRNGVENGLCVLFDTLGRIESKFDYKNGKINGEGLKYFENGIVSFKATFKNDTIQGYAIYFYGNGDTMKVMRYKGEQMSLPYFKWLENGQILKGEAVNNEKQILWTWMDRKRNTLKSKLVNFGSMYIVPE